VYGVVVGVVVAVVTGVVVVAGVVVPVVVTVVVVVGVEVGVVRSQVANSPSTYISNAWFNRVLTALHDARVLPRMSRGLSKHFKFTSSADELVNGAIG
jgi:hypothetical protein